MKIALVYDGLFCRSGGERVLLNFHNAFPEAEVFTAVYVPNDTYPELRECKIHTTWFQRFAKNEAQYKARFYPLAVWAMQQVDLSGYDVILMATTHCAKYVKYSHRTLSFCYCFTPFRLAWNPNSYRAYEQSRGLKRMLFNLVLSRLRSIDLHHARRVNHFLAMTRETSQRIRDQYHFQGEIPVFNPPIDCRRYKPSRTVDSYYLVVSRLERYKKVDLVIETCNRLKLPLKVVGRGVEKQNLVRLAGPTIEFLEGLTDAELASLYSRCKAFIFPQHEDYGLTPLEAIASGRPVIAFRKGGVEETMIPFTGDSRQCTAVMFSRQDSPSLEEAIRTAEGLDFDPVFIRKHAETFDAPSFEQRIRDFVQSRYESSQ